MRLMKMKIFRRKMDDSNGEASSSSPQPQDPPPTSCNSRDAVDNSFASSYPMAESKDERVKMEILEKLRCALSEDREVTSIDHIRQSETWDCGECVAMENHHSLSE